MRGLRIAAICFAALLATDVAAQTPSAAPVARVYKTTPQGELRLHLVVPPDSSRAASRGAVVVLHGGGWHSGDAAWTFGTAARYAGKGLVGVSVQYRLSDQKDVTPIDAMADVRDAIRWLRRNARELGIDPDRIVAHGTSAGAHLAASAALIAGADKDTVDARPNALVMNSPAVAVKEDAWFTRIVLARAPVESLSPDAHVRTGAPPALIVMGADDTVTPLAGTQRFCERMRAAGSRCELNAYPKLGHVLTRNLDPRAQEQGPFDTDPQAAADARDRIDRFLSSLGYYQR